MKKLIDDLRVYLYKNIFWIFTLIGVLLLVLVTFIEDDLVKELFEKAGIAILSSGVFASVLKTLQFKKIFSDEIQDIMLKGKFIRNRKDLPKLWFKISNELYNKKFPDISSELNSMIKNKYFPIDSDYYYSNFEVTINIEELTDDDIIKFTQTCKFSLVLSQDKKKINYKQAITNDNINGESTLKFERLYFKFNGEKLEGDFKTEQLDNETRKIYNVELKTDSNNDIEVKDRREYSIKYDNIKIFRVGTITKEMDVSISFPKNLEVTFFNVGVVNNFEPKHVEHNRYIGRIHKKGLILPFQGFGLSFRKN